MGYLERDENIQRQHWTIGLHFIQLENLDYWIGLVSLIGFIYMSPHRQGSRAVATAPTSPVLLDRAFLIDGHRLEEISQQTDD